MATIFTINADSTPILDEWGWADYWGVYDWIRWHALNVVKYGKQKANEKFIQWWNSQSIDANPWNWGKYNPDFRAYLEKYDLLPVVTNVVADVVSGTTGAVSGASEAIKDITAGAGATIKTASFLLPAIFIIILIIALISLQKKLA
jgi:hypothetical protein